MTTPSAAEVCDKVMRQTLAHKVRVGTLINQMAAHLMQRAVDHDNSKFWPEEWESFVRGVPLLEGAEYGSLGYGAALEELRPAIEHHYRVNRHHAEHFRWKCHVCQRHFSDADYEAAPRGPNDSGKRYCPHCCCRGMIYEALLREEVHGGLDGMTLLDLIEMLAGWKTAGERDGKGNLAKSLEINQRRLSIPPALVAIPVNTAKAMGWWPEEEAARL